MHKKSHASIRYAAAVLNDRRRASFLAVVARRERQHKYYDDYSQIQAEYIEAAFFNMLRDYVGRLFYKWARVPAKTQDEHAYRERIRAKYAETLITGYMRQDTPSDRNVCAWWSEFIEENTLEPVQVPVTGGCSTGASEEDNRRAVPRGNCMHSKEYTWWCYRQTPCRAADSVCSYLE